jgi:hypothetical protein
MEVNATSDVDQYAVAMVLLILTSLLLKVRLVFKSHHG